jgi:predicted DNA-binding transcriptional regulator AlpA
MSEPNDSKDRMLPTRLVRKRYGIVDRTINRWVDKGILPEPMRINGLRYWRESELAQREREGMSARNTGSLPAQPQGRQRR